MRSVVMLLVLIVALFSIALPLRNYVQQHAEIASLNASIQAKEEQKQRLLDELEKNNSPAYREEQARRRLGAIKPGDTAFRIGGVVNPQEATATGRQDAPQTWYVQLWGSVMAG